MLLGIHVHYTICVLGSLVAQFCSWHLLCLSFPCWLLLHSFLKRKELEFPSTPSITVSPLSLPFLTKFLVTSASCPGLSSARWLTSHPISELLCWGGARSPTSWVKLTQRAQFSLQFPWFGAHRSFPPWFPMGHFTREFHHPSGAFLFYFLCRFLSLPVT